MRKQREKEEMKMSRILIVEDETAIAELEKDYLELSGFERSEEHTSELQSQR